MSKASYDDSVDYNNCPICDSDIKEPEIDEEMTKLMSESGSTKIMYVKGKEPYVRYTCCGSPVHFACQAKCDQENTNQCVTKNKCPCCGKKYKKRGTAAEAKHVVKWANQGAEWAKVWLQKEADNGNEHAQKEKENVTDA